MKIVFLTSGPRGSGKSTYIETEQARNPEITVASRDKILLSLYGKTSLSPYDGEHHNALNVLFQEVGDFLSLDLPEQMIILDCWNGFSSERKSIIRMLREMGADKVYCLYFVTPLNFCLRWFFQKPDSKGRMRHSIAGDYGLYHKTAETILEDGFDGVFQINPTQLELPFNQSV